ncbi:MAG: thioesterase family protein [Actinomycetota bacterium]|nr:thioesterase family protein [Actinomycetota bacterium]
MPDSYFTPISPPSASSEQTPGVSRFRAGPSTVGPWAPNLQHGGPPNALAVALAEKAVFDATGRTDLIALRLSADFIGAVPVAEIEVRARVLRSARSAALAEVVIAAAGRDCLHARVWFVRGSDTAELTASLPDPIEVPDVPAGLDSDFGYGASLEWRFVRGGMSVPGPGAAWVRPTMPLADGLELSGLARVVLVADSASGISAELDWTRWSFVNVDLDVHLARPFEGDWILMDATTQLGAYGSALARSTLSDVRGVVGSGLQTLVLAPIPTG